MGLSVGLSVNGEITDMLELDDLVAPAGPAWLEAPGEQLQTLGISANVRPQHLCGRRETKGREDDKRWGVQ